jgi:cell division protein FtsN
MAADFTPPPPPSSLPPPPPPIDPPLEYLRRPRDHDAPVEVAARGGGGRGLGFAFLALITVGVFGAAIWYAYQQGVRRGMQEAPPLIKADSSPIKVAPERPGGMQVPDRDKTVYDRLSGQPKSVEVEKLLPPPEFVIEKPLAIVRDAGAVAAPAEVKPTASVTAAAVIETQPDPEPEPEVKPEVIPVAKPPAQAAGKPPDKSVASAEAKPLVKASAPVTRTSDYLIQVGAYRTPRAAQTGWTRLVGANRALLGRLKPIVVRADLGDRGFFHRLRAGPVDGAEAAAALCARLKRRKVGCLVIKP